MGQIKYQVKNRCERAVNNGRKKLILNKSQKYLSKKNLIWFKYLFLKKASLLS